MSICHRKALAKFRCGVAPINLELLRYNGTPYNERFCPFCPNIIEDELHIVNDCQMYDDLRNQFFHDINALDNTFYRLDRMNKLIFILDNNVCIRLAAKYLHETLQRRRIMLYDFN